MFFASDNAGPALPSVMKAVAEENISYAMPYGKDPLTAAVETQLREIFEAPEAAVFLVATGTAANALSLATLTQPWQTVFCTPEAHIQVDECNAPEFYSGGAKLTLVGAQDKLAPAELDHAIRRAGQKDVHTAQPGAVCLTQVTEFGQLYEPSELKAICDVAKSHDLPVYMDGARFSNAMVALGCSAAEMTWKQGVDVVSFGGTKNGCLGVEAVVFFDPAKAWEFQLRRKRGAHLFSKNRFLAAQMQGYLSESAWIDAARAANRNCATLAKALRSANAAFLHEPQANMIFCRLPRATHDRLREAGAVYYLMEGNEGGAAEDMLLARFVCDWSLSEENLNRFIALL